MSTTTKPSPLPPEVLRGIRLDMGWQLKDVAAYMDVSVRSVQRWEAPRDAATHRTPGGPALRLYHELRARLHDAEAPEDDS